MAKRTFRTCLSAMAALATAAGLLGAPNIAHGQTWPAKPVRIIVPVLAGAFTDLGARSIAGELSDQLGQQVLVENRTGGGGTIGADFVAKSAPDGYTFLFTENGFSMAPALYPKLPYDPLRDFMPITPVAEAPTIWVARMEFQAKNAREMVELARARPGDITVGSGGQGTSSHLANELFLSQQGIRMLHVPFKGVVASYAEVVAGRVDLGVSSIASPMGHIRAGRVRAIAVTGKERSALLPNLPAISETVPGFQASIFNGMMAPAATAASPKLAMACTA